jgi:choice-of-anchor A domain-containing protein
MHVAPNRFRFFVFAVLVATIGLISKAQAAFMNLGPAGDYNVFVFNDNSQFGSDAEGKVAVGHNANFGTGFTIASSMGNNTDNLIVGNDYSNNGHSVKGNVIVNGNVLWNTPSVSGDLNVNGNATLTGGGMIDGQINVVGTFTAPAYMHNSPNPTVTPLPFSFTDVQTYLNAESAFLATLPANGTTSIVFDQLQLTGVGAPGLYVFNVHGADLANAAGHGFSLTVPSGSTAIVNIDGTNDLLTGFTMQLNGTDNQHVLYNFFQATSLNIGLTNVSGISVEGTVLAPYANIHFNAGQINGTLIGYNLDGPGESHLHLFQGDIPSVPEPSSVVLLTVGGLALASVAYRRRRA